jgi:hypothetical protein
MYGFGLPLLFPFAIASFFVMFLMENTLLYYSYRRPPMYDETLSEMVLDMLFYVPVFYLAFGYWMCSNK